MKEIELLAPAGDLEKLKIAVVYGADAVYLGGPEFSLRSSASNFSVEELKEGTAFAKERGVKVYVAINSFIHEEEVPLLKEYIDSIRRIPFDAYIVSDIAALLLVKEEDSEKDIHLSTQANTTNHKTARFFYELGVKRVVLARELSLSEIRSLRDNTPKELEIEGFVHGAMCISYSGRCLLSKAMTGRDANRGDCAHPCRYKYNLVEEKRPGEYYPVMEDQRGTYVLNSKDLNMLSYIPELYEAGITSFKIEGRMKSIFYVASTVSVYRKAIDSFLKDKGSYHLKEEWLNEISKASHRQYTTGFYIPENEEEREDINTSGYSRDYTIIGIVKEENSEGKVLIEQRNKFVKGDEIEIMGPFRDVFHETVLDMEDIEGNRIQDAPHPQQLLYLTTRLPLKPYDILIKRKEK